MPPKGRPRAAPRAPRGGRSGAAAADAPAAETPVAEAETSDPPAATSIPASSAATETKTASGSAPIAIPPPSGRLEGLGVPVASRSGGRAAASGTAASPPLPFGERPKPKIKFAPKNTIRKTKEEREQLNRQHEPPPNDDSLNAFGITRGGVSGRGARGRGRGRGGGLGRGDTKREEAAVASGPFAMGSVMTNRGKQKVSIERLSRSMYRTGGISSKTRVKREPDADGVIKEDYSSSDSEGGPKVDVELIDLISDEEPDPEGEDKKGLRGFAPVRIERHEHVDRAAAANEAKKKTDTKKDVKGKARAESPEETKSRGRRYSGTTRVKSESKSPVATRRVRSPADVRKKQSQSRSPEDTRRKPRVGRSRSGARKGGPVLISQEDYEEHDRYEMDRFQMLKELGPALPGRTNIDAEGDHEMEGAALPAPPDERDTKLYLFQFPPVLPVLEAATAVEDVAIKEEGADNPNHSTTAGSSAGADQKPPRSPEIKAKDRPSAMKKERFNTLDEVLRAPLPSGAAGKLQVHQSGKITILFGGIEFEVHKGMDCDFLQDIVVLQKEVPGHLDEKGKPKGRAWGMGQLKGKFVATPDIGKLISTKK